MFGDILTSQKWLKPLYSTSELSGWENRPFQVTWSEVTEPNRDTLVPKIQMQKPKRFRTMYTTHQLETLENIYKEVKYVSAIRREEIAKQLNISSKCIKVWFQNRRMKEKRESSGSSFDSSGNSSSLFKPGTLKLVTKDLPAKTIAWGVQDVQQKYPQHYIFPPHIENVYNLSAQSESNVPQTNYNDLSGCNFPNDASIYPTQQNYPSSAAYYTNTEQYPNLANDYVNGYDLQTSSEFNINQFQL